MTHNTRTQLSSLIKSARDMMRIASSIRHTYFAEFEKLHSTLHALQETEA